MGLDLQKTGPWKRIAAWMLDIILLVFLAIGFAFLLSQILGYGDYFDNLENALNKYEEQYGVEFDITAEEYETKTPEEKEKYDSAYNAFLSDEKAMHSYNMMTSLSLLIVTFSILLAYLVLEFAVPLVLKNGQTVGKKCFGFGLMRQDGVKLSTLQLFVRAVLGKYTLETMIPVYIIMMIIAGQMGIVGLAVLLILPLVQAGMLFFTKNNSLIHDVVSGTVAIDIQSQMIFESSEELIEYQKQIAAEKAKKQAY